MSPDSQEWYAEWFDETYLKVYAHRNVALAKPEVEFIVDQFRLEPGHRILDLGCGTGRHLWHLERLGFDRAVGIDLSEVLLRVASHELMDSTRLVRGDMRRLPFGTHFDAVLSLFTSFGYFEADSENLEVLREIQRLLVRNGKFILDLVSYGVADRLVAESNRSVEGLEVSESRRYDRKTRRIEKEITIRGDEGSKRFHESIRVYSYAEMKQMLAEAGLCLTGVFGDFRGTPFDPRCERMIAVGIRLEAPLLYSH